jgi:sigma-B regulation protein RsbQ
MDVLARSNVRVSGRGDGQPMLFTHGYGCDQDMWRYVAPRFEADFRMVRFDYVGGLTGQNIGDRAVDVASP